MVTYQDDRVKLIPDMVKTNLLPDFLSRYSEEGVVDSDDDRIALIRPVNPSPTSTMTPVPELTSISRKLRKTEVKKPHYGSTPKVFTTPIRLNQLEIGEGSLYQQVFGTQSNSPECQATKERCRRLQTGEEPVS